MRRLPSTQVERDRLTEQMMRQFEVDIDRLWRRIQTMSGVGIAGSDDALDPDTYEPPEGVAVGGGGTCPNVVLVSVWGYPSAGTVTYATSLRSNFSVDWDAEASDFNTALSGLGCVVDRGPFPNNDIRIELPEGESLTMASFSLTQRTGCPVPFARTDV